MIPSTSLQDAVALLTVAIDARDDDELHAMVTEFRRADHSDELLLAVVALCRSLCLAVSKMVHVVDDELSNGQADALTEDELLPMALHVIRSYGTAAAHHAERRQDQLRPAS